jgi:hypothetical protein
MKKLKTYEACCKKLGKDPVKELPFSKPANGFHKALNAYAKLFIIAEALNEGWVPDWADSDQYKYYPWLLVKKNTKNPSGFGLSFGDCGFGTSRTRVSALAFALKAASWPNMPASSLKRNMRKHT